MNFKIKQRNNMHLHLKNKVLNNIKRYCSKYLYHLYRYLRVSRSISEKLKIYRYSQNRIRLKGQPLLATKLSSISEFFVLVTRKM